MLPEGEERMAPAYHRVFKSAALSRRIVRKECRAKGATSAIKYRKPDWASPTTEASSHNYALPIKC